MAENETEAAGAELDGLDGQAQLPDLTDAPPIIHGRPVHPVANLFPLMTGEDFEALVADIRDHGVREAGWIDVDGRILDGRNRAVACEQLGREMPSWYVYEGDDVAGFVASMNLHRRHLSEGLRVLLAAKVASMRQGARTDLRPGGRKSEDVSQEEAAKLFQVSPRQVRRGKLVLVHGTKEEVAAVEQGKEKVAAVERKVRARLKAEKPKRTKPRRGSGSGPDPWPKPDKLTKRDAANMLLAAMIDASPEACMEPATGRVYSIDELHHLPGFGGGAASIAGAAGVQITDLVRWLVRRKLVIAYPGKNFDVILYKPSPTAIAAHREREAQQKTQRETATKATTPKSRKHADPVGRAMREVEQACAGLAAKLADAYIAPDAPDVQRTVAVLSKTLESLAKQLDDGGHVPGEGGKYYTVPRGFARRMRATASATRQLYLRSDHLSQVLRRRPGTPTDWPGWEHYRNMRYWMREMQRDCETVEQRFTTTWKAQERMSDAEIAKVFGAD